MRIIFGAPDPYLNSGMARGFYGLLPTLDLVPATRTDRGAAWTATNACLRAGPVDRLCGPRVCQLCLPPPRAISSCSRTPIARTAHNDRRGATTPIHTHRWPSVEYVLRTTHDRGLPTAGRSGIIRFG